VGCREPIWKDGCSNWEESASKGDDLGYHVEFVCMPEEDMVVAV
jgi:hypothetical protein